MDAVNNLKAVLCDPDGKCCIAGSDADRQIVDSALDALERLTAGDVAFPDHPEPMVMKWSELEIAAIADYGDRRAAAAVLAERERCANIALNSLGITTGSVADAIRKGTP